MSKSAEEEIAEREITSLKSFDRPGGLLEQLHDVGCERHRVAAC